MKLLRSASKQSTNGAPFAGTRRSQTAEDLRARISDVVPDRDSLGGLGGEVPQALGLTTEAAIETARAQGIENIRVVEAIDGRTIAPMTMDRRPKRLNLIVEAGIVISAGSVSHEHLPVRCSYGLSSPNFS